MRRRRVIILTVGSSLVVGAAITAAVVSARTPSLAREWDEDVRVLTEVETRSDGVVRLGQVRDWRYTRDSVVTRDYVAARYDADDIQDLWLYEQELGLGGRIAHTFLVFEFSEDYGPMRWLGLSVETRREVGETYSLIGGVLRAFEVTHIWANEEDLVTRRVEFLDYPLTRYRVSVAKEHIARIFRQFVDETVALATTPRWYNTLTTNCTSSLIAYVNKVEADAIPWHYSFMFTGRTDTYLGQLGYLDLASAQPITREWLTANPLR
jgi:hypothetical protein